MKYLKTYNESIKHLLKPKSEEEISKQLDSLGYWDKLLVACKYGLIDIVKQLESYIKGLPEDHNYPLVLASKYGNIDIVNIFIRYWYVSKSRR